MLASPSCSSSEPGAEKSSRGRLVCLLPPPAAPPAAPTVSEVSAPGPRGSVTMCTDLVTAAGCAALPAECTVGAPMPALATAAGGREMRNGGRLAVGSAIVHRCWWRCM